AQRGVGCRGSRNVSIISTGRAGHKKERPRHPTVEAEVGRAQLTQWRRPFAGRKCVRNQRMGKCISCSRSDQKEGPDSLSRPKFASKRPVMTGDETAAVLDAHAPDCRSMFCEVTAVRLFLIAAKPFCGDGNRKCGVVLCTRLFR